MSVEPYPLVRRLDPKTGRDQLVETHPDACANGHDWTRRRTVSPGHVPCGLHGGHRSWTCLTPGCDAPPVIDPPHDGDLPRS